MGQVESKSDVKEVYPFYPTDSQIRKICFITDLDTEEIKLYWDHVWVIAVKENGKVDFENFVKHFCKQVSFEISF